MNRMMTTCLVIGLLTAVAAAPTAAATGSLLNVVDQPKCEAADVGVNCDYTYECESYYNEEGEWVTECESTDCALYVDALNLKCVLVLGDIYAAIAAHDSRAPLLA